MGKIGVKNLESDFCFTLLFGKLCKSVASFFCNNPM